ncbi:hypothetical protein AAC387_Pa09g1283 [Persea americana]
MDLHDTRNCKTGDQNLTRKLRSIVIWRSCLYGLRWCGIDSGGTPNRCDMLKWIELDDPLHRHHFDMSKENNKAPRKEWLPLFAFLNARFLLLQS